MQRRSGFFFCSGPYTVVWNKQESRRKYWATSPSICSFARTAHSFVCSGLLASLAPSAVLTRLSACSLRSLPCSWESELFDGYFVCVFFPIFDHSAQVFFWRAFFAFWRGFILSSAVIMLSVVLCCFALRSSNVCWLFFHFKCFNGYDHVNYSSILNDCPKW